MTEHGKASNEITQTPDGPRAVAICLCGERFVGKNKGASGFMVAAHVKKAHGQPVFAPKVPQAVPALREVDVEEIAKEIAKGYLLPATLVRVPSAEYTVERYRTFRGAYASEGPGFEATLTRWGKPVAKVRYNGDGGDTQVQWNDYTLNTTPHAIVVGIPYGDDLNPQHASTPEEAAFLRWGGRFTGMWDEEMGLSWCFDGVVAALTEEAAQLKALKARKNTPILRKGEDPRKQFATLNTPDRKATAKWCMEHGHTTARVWNYTAWVPAAELVSA